MKHRFKTHCGAIEFGRPVTFQVLPMPRPPSDPCDWAAHRLIDIEADYQKAIAEATSRARCQQIAERLAVIISELALIATTAQRKADQLREAR